MLGAFAPLTSLEFSLKKLPLEVEKLKEALSKDPNVLFAYLFGSYAAGLQRRDSDIDVAIYFKRPPVALSFLDYLFRLGEISGRNVDLISLNGTSPFLKRQVLKDGIPLVVKDRVLFKKFTSGIVVVDKMADADKELVERKLKKMEELLRELRSVSGISLSECSKNVVLKRFIERNLELLIEQMFKICNHIVAKLSGKASESYAHCFEVLVQHGVISRRYLETYKKMARFGNLLVHLYDDVDDSLVFSIYNKNLSDFELFIREVRAFLTNP